jgi:tetratricopeptide (TPR) repeat protein
MHKLIHKNVLFWVLIITIVISTSCAYFNTYYNAETAYKKGRHAHELLDKKSTVDTVAVLPGTITDSYDRAIAKASKLLDVYPKSKKWHDDALYLMARASFYREDYPASIRRIKRLQREFPESPFIPESYMYLAKAYIANENLANAEETLLFALEKYPELNKKEEITFLLARISLKRQGKSQAIALLEKTLAAVKSIERKQEIILEIARLSMETGDYKKAIAYLKSAPRNKKTVGTEYRIDILLLECLLQNHQFGESLEFAEKMLKDRRYIQHIPEIKLKKALSLSGVGRTKDATDLLVAVTRENGIPSVTAVAWYELGRLYQNPLGNFVKARECYEKASSLLPEGAMRKDAGERMRAIDAIATLARPDTTTNDSAVLSDTGLTAFSQEYRIGELYWLNLDEPDSAIRHFSRISNDQKMADSLVIRSLYARAWISLHIKSDSLNADSLFGLIVERDSSSLIAQQSQKELGRPVTIITRDDSAKTAFLAAEKLMFEDSNAIAAATAYYKVAKSFPEHPLAPQSLYAAAWICDFVLENNAKAQDLYKLLCKYFPESNVCKQNARPRLKAAEDSLAAREKQVKNISQPVKKVKVGTIPVENSILDSAQIPDSEQAKDSVDINDN